MKGMELYGRVRNAVRIVGMSAVLTRWEITPQGFEPPNGGIKNRTVLLSHQTTVQRGCIVSIRYWAGCTTNTPRLASFAFWDVRIRPAQNRLYS